MIQCAVLRIGTLTGAPLCRDSHLLCMPNPNSNDMLDPPGHDVDCPHSLRGSYVGSPCGPNASLLVGSTWNPHDGSTSDPHMPECRFQVEPILSLQLVNIFII